MEEVGEFSPLDGDDVRGLLVIALGILDGFLELLD
jgi:hypothetical protein